MTESVPARGFQPSQPSKDPEPLLTPPAFIPNLDFACHGSVSQKQEALPPTSQMRREEDEEQMEEESPEYVAICRDKPVSSQTPTCSFTSPSPVPAAVASLPSEDLASSSPCKPTSQPPTAESFSSSIARAAPGNSISSPCRIEPAERLTAGGSLVDSMPGRMTTSRRDPPARPVVSFFDMLKDLG